MFKLQRGLCLVVLLAAGAAFGETVKKVTVRALDKFDTDATDVLQYCSVKEGDSHTQEELTKILSKDVRTLLDTERLGIGLDTKITDLALQLFDIGGIGKSANQDHILPASIGRCSF